MQIYYYANSLYQLAHVLPLYEKVGGSFVVKNRKNYLRFKRYLRNTAVHGERNLFKTPDVQICRRRDLHMLPPGVLIFAANAIKYDKDYNNHITVFYEHGSSDKKYDDGKESGVLKLKKYDYIFLWGPKNRQKILDLNVKIENDKLIEVGGFRFDKYNDHDYLRDKRKKQLGIDNDRKTVLYAPTWAFGNGTLKELGNYFIKEITKDHNLIIRPHYHDRNYGRLIYNLARLRGIKNVFYSNPSDIIGNDLLADFAASDLLISDISSVVYEYLITGKPLLLIDNEYKNKHNMGDMLNVYNHVEKFKQGMDINELLEKSFARNYDEIFEELRDSIFYSIGESAVDKAEQFLRKLEDEDHEKK